MFGLGISVYSTRKYARSSFDKYIQSNGEMNELAIEMTTINYLFWRWRATSESPTWHFKEQTLPRHENIDEQNTFFVRNCRPNRFKVCRKYVPHPNAYLPTSVLTKKIERLAFDSIHCTHFLLMYSYISLHLIFLWLGRCMVFNQDVDENLRQLPPDLRPTFR